MIVQRRYLDAAGDQLGHYRVHFLAGQHEVTHHHALVTHPLKGHPAAERKARFDVDAIEGDFEIASRQTDAIHAPGSRARLTERLRHLLLPVILRTRGADEEEEEAYGKTGGHGRHADDLLHGNLLGVLLVIRIVAESRGSGPAPARRSPPALGRE